MNTLRRKLIEVALPLEAINREAAREKSIRHGHPSTIHLWWARRPLAAARAVIFAQMVDDPGSVPEEFPTPKEQEKERQRLFRLIEELVLWENTTNEEVLRRAREEIRRSWVRWCRESGEDPEKLPPFHDPFAGGGALPLEAQRLGLEAHASDLNPVAVLINKAMIEIPPRFAGQPPINPEARNDKQLITRTWTGAAGLAEDVRYYGRWMRDEAEKRIGHLYPKAKVTADLAKARPNLKPYVGRELTVIAWLWARTVESSNPAYRGCHVPLISTFWLSTKTGKEAWIEPVVDGKSYLFEVRTGKPRDKAAVDAGTKLGRGANFRCMLSQSPLAADYIKAEGMAGRMGVRLMAIVAESNQGRVYLPSIEEHEAIARQARPEWKPEGDVPSRLTGGTCYGYGLTTWGALFTPRQLVALTTFSDLVGEGMAQINRDAVAAGRSAGASPPGNGEMTGAALGDSIGTYLGMAVSKAADYNSSLVVWSPRRDQAKSTFARHALPMVWDFAEVNPLAEAAGDVSVSLSGISKAIEKCPASNPGFVTQEDARKQRTSARKVVSTDPPYYDNIGYADLSDFFYVWLRRSLRSIFPDIFSTLTVPKMEELVAAAFRHGSKEKAEAYFLDGMTEVMRGLADQAHPAFPVTIYYAFKQSEENTDGGTQSTGWETFLAAMVSAGFGISGTWPIRTERGSRSVGIDANALASSIVLVCRSRPSNAKAATRREFVTALKAELPTALRRLQQGNIAPVDLAQASIGPGMAVFSRYSMVLEFDGKPMTVRTALQLINQVLDETLAEQEGDFDPDTAWAVAWFEQFGFNDGPFGDAETLCKAKNTAINALVQAGVVKAGAGRTRLLRVDELPDDWDPETDKRLTVWEMVHHMIRVLESGGESAAAALAVKLGSRAEVARELAYRLYTVSERKKRAQEALRYNALVQSWPEIMRLSREKTPAQQTSLFGEE